MSRRAAPPEVGTTAPEPLAPVGPGGFVLTAACPSDIRLAILANGRILVIGRASNYSGAKALEAAVHTVYSGTDQLGHRYGIQLGHLLPNDPDVLKAHHESTGKARQHKETNGRPFTVRWSLWTPPGTPGLTVLLVTGSGTKIDAASLDQPALKRAALVARQLRPAVVFTHSLSRIGRGYPAALMDVLQSLSQEMAYGPFLGDTRTALAKPDLALKMQLAIQGLAAEDDAKNIVERNRAGMRARTGKKHLTLPGVWEFGSNRIPPPGLITLKLRTPDHPTPWNALVLDCPAARPPEKLVNAGLTAPLVPGTEKVADQVALIRWLGEHLYVGQWDTRACAAKLARDGYAPLGLRYRRGMEIVDGEIREAPAVRQHDGYAGRNDGRDALQSFFNNLDFYETGELTVNLADDRPITLTGVLPLDGKPWITAAQARRIRQFEARRHSGPKEKHLFAGLPVIIDGVRAVLKPKWRKRKGAPPELVYTFVRADDHRRAARSPRAQVIPPVPAATLAQWYAEALAALAHPLSLQLADRPADPDSWQAKVDVLDAEVSRLEADLTRRQKQLDRADPDARPFAYAHLVDLVDETGRTLQTRQDDLAFARLQADSEADEPVLDGTPVAGLVKLAGALLDPKDRSGLRLVLRDELTESLVLATTRRISIGRRPAYDLQATLTLRIQDSTDSWRAVSHHSWTGGCAIERTPAKIARAVDGLYAGTPLWDRTSLGADWMYWYPAVRAALGCTGRFAFARTDDPRLLRLGMAVMHPRRTAVAVPEDPEDIPCYADPPVDPTDLPALARRLREPVALLRAIRDSYAEPSNKWLRQDMPAIAACYAAADDGDGTLPWRLLPTPLRPRPDGRPGPHPLATDWTRTHDGRAAVRPCWCGSVGRVLLLVREVTGTVCRDCRRDRARVVWDPAYDRYRHRAPC